MIDYCKTCVHDEDRADFCDNCYYCGMLNDRGIAPTGYEETKKRTNWDRIRAMSDEEFAEWFIDRLTDEVVHLSGKVPAAKETKEATQEWLWWLKQEENREYFDKRHEDANTM